MNLIKYLIILDEYQNLFHINIYIHIKKINQVQYLFFMII